MTFAFKLTTHLNFFFNYFKVFFFATLKKQTICCVTTLPRFDPAPRNTSRCLRPNSTNASEVAVQGPIARKKPLIGAPSGLPLILGRIIWTLLDALTTTSRPISRLPVNNTWTGTATIDMIFNVHMNANTMLLDGTSIFLPLQFHGRFRMTRFN